MLVSSRVEVEPHAVDARRAARRSRARWRGRRRAASTWWSSAYTPAAAKMPDLAHRAAEHPPVADERASTSLARAGEHRAARAAEPLRQRDRDEVERRGQRRRVVAAGGRGVEQPRAVEVGRDAVLARRAARPRSQLGRGPRRARPSRLWVFSTSTSVVGGNSRWPRGLRAARNSSAVNSPPAPISVNWTPALAAAAPVSCQTAWLSRADDRRRRRAGSVELERELVGHRPGRERTAPPPCRAGRRPAPGAR